VRSVLLDKSDSPGIIFTKASWTDLEMKPEVIYSSCSAANITLPSEGDGEEDADTMALPEQFYFRGRQEGTTNKAKVELFEHAD